MATTDEPELDIGSRLLYHGALGGTFHCRVTGATAGLKVVFGKADDHESFVRWVARCSAPSSRRAWATAASASLLKRVI